MLESPFRSPLILAAAQPLPLINHCCGAAATIDGAQRSDDPYAAACHAVYRKPGGVPTPPNLRPVSRAGTAPCKGLPQAANARERP